jgi:aminomethyltransferase
MPLQYRYGIIQEHLTTRREAGLFDVSHMGRFVIRGKDMLPFLQYVLSNNAAALEIGESQYTMIPNERGGAVDDAYLYRFMEGEYLLVVNAANRNTDWEHLKAASTRFNQVEIIDQTMDLTMLSLQGPLSRDILSDIISTGYLPEPQRNQLSTAQLNGASACIGRTGYTGDPVGFELFIDQAKALDIWDALIDRGACPVGLGARDTLRLEAGLPLYGHELGYDPEEKEIPIFACNLARIAVSFSELKGEFIGKQALLRQFESFKEIVHGTDVFQENLPRMIMPVELLEKGIARAEDRVFSKDKHIGFVTSGTMVPYWTIEGEGIASWLTDRKGLRAVCLALLDSTFRPEDEIEIEIRGKRVKGVIVEYHLRNDAPPFARSIVRSQIPQEEESLSDRETVKKVRTLLNKAEANHLWRQRECVNLIPSEQTQSKMVRLLSMMDPTGRYAEHKQMKALYDAEVFYYQGTGFIAEVENLLEAELREFLNCLEVETRVISGQMANVAVFSAMVDFINRADRKSEQRRIRKILNHHIIKGGHLSAQPMGALRDFVRRDPKTEKPAVVNFPVLIDNPYKIDVNACRSVIADHRPEMIIFGKSMTLHKEPVAEIRALVDELSLDCVIMYDMAHVVGLVGPHFQQPFEEGADIVTASTHKTYFGTQRGIIAGNYPEEDIRYPLWEAIQRRAFPGSVSNHHLGTLLGLLMAAYEMNFFKDEYQKKVISNAKAFARALKETGLDVAGDPGISYTETHQVIINVGYARGPEIAHRLEENNIIANYQAAPDEEGFTASGSIRMGVSEMTRFGMEPGDFPELAQFMHDVIIRGRPVKDEVKAFRKRFQDMKYCFSGEEYSDLIETLYRTI